MSSCIIITWASIHPTMTVSTVSAISSITTMTTTIIAASSSSSIAALIPIIEGGNVVQARRDGRGTSVKVIAREVQVGQSLQLAEVAGYGAWEVIVLQI